MYQETPAKNCTFETPSHNVDYRNVIQWLRNDFLTVAKEDL